MGLLELVDLNKIYRVGETDIVAVDNVTVSIGRGEFLSIVGHSGSGKTTLISIMGGILKASSGSVKFDGTDISSLDDRALSDYRNTRIGFMFQFSSLLPVLTSRENVLLPVLFSSGRREDGKRAVELLEMVGLEDKVESCPPQLSGGQQRRVAIARALMNRPDVILADEPTGDLDEETESEIMGLFHRINETEKVTIVLITHNLELARQAGTQFRMSSGKLLPV